MQRTWTTLNDHSLMITNMVLQAQIIELCAVVLILHNQQCLSTERLDRTNESVEKYIEM